MPAWVLSKPKADQELAFVQFTPALLRWAIFADSVGMCPMWACIAHFDNCMRIGEEERVAGRGSGLAVTYDEVLRKHVADMSRAGVHGFTASGALSSIDKDIVDRARAVRNEKQPAKSSASTRHDESQHKHSQV